MHALCPALATAERFASAGYDTAFVGRPGRPRSVRPPDPAGGEPVSRPADARPHLVENEQAAGGQDHHDVLALDGLDDDQRGPLGDRGAQRRGVVARLSRTAPGPVGEVAGTAGRGLPAVTGPVNPSNGAARSKPPPAPEPGMPG
ncbi:hypothetical protein STBA_64940 [Streptomyces sp. MP131-18]|nr:hypothetical protein STBA_64940 [Streptomyces sp. MP131-18]